MTQIPIKRAVERVPGGMMVVPLLCGAVLATLAPGTAKFFGSFTGALFTGALPILAVFFVCTGASIDFKATPYILKKGGTLFAVKVGIGVLLGVIFGRLLGESPVSAGMFAGISTLAIVASMNDTNGGLYMALMGQYGQPRDVGAYTVMSLESGPFLTMVTLGVAGLAAFPWPTLVGGILPLLFGMLLGNLDREMREFLSRAIPVMIPFFAFALGANLDLAQGVAGGVVRRRARTRRGGGDRHPAVLRRPAHRWQWRGGRRGGVHGGQRRGGPGHHRQRQPRVRRRGRAGHDPGRGLYCGHRHRGAAGHRMDRAACRCAQRLNAGSLAHRRR